MKKNQYWSDISVYTYKYRKREIVDLRGVEPDQIEGIEIERRVRAVEDGPGSKLRRSKAGDYDAGELRVVAGGSVKGSEKKNHHDQVNTSSHWRRRERELWNLWAD